MLRLYRSKLLSKRIVELSCKSEYAILALLELATHYQKGEPLQIRQIAMQQNIPDRYLEQLLATLRRGGLVKSQRGSKGGYFLTREPWKITLFDVFVCVEGLDKLKNTEEDSKSKTNDGAAIKDIWEEAKQAANLVLQKYTLLDLCEKRDSQKNLDIMYYI
jgi:Rrf2 family protein